MIPLISRAQSGALFVVRSDLATARVSGPDRASWLNALLTQDVANFKPGAGACGLALNKRGRIVTEAFVVASTDHLLVALDAANLPNILEHLEHYLVMEDAELSSPPEPFTWMIAYGPLALSASADLRSIPGTVCGPLSHFGHPAFLFAVPTHKAQAWIAERTSDDGFAITDLEAFDAVRIDLGVMRFGVDFSDSTYPEEAGLDAHAINFNKGCYLGQEVVVKMKSRGHPSKKVVRLIAAADAPLRIGDPVSTAAGEATGVVSSCAPSNVLAGRVVAFATVRMPDSKPGAVLRVGAIDATVATPHGVIRVVD